MTDSGYYDAESFDIRIGGVPMRQWVPSDEQRERRQLPELTFKMSLPIEPGATRLLLRELRRRGRNRRKRERRERRARA